MLSQEQELILSKFSGLYDIVVPQDNLLRRINTLVDFSFVYQELVDKYCPDNGRMAESPIRMFKYLLLKVIYDISDVDVVERSFPILPKPLPYLYLICCPIVVRLLFDCCSVKERTIDVHQMHFNRTREEADAWVRRR